MGAVSVVGDSVVAMSFTKQTHCKRGHLFTEDSVYWSTHKDGHRYRQCKICRNAYSRASYQARTKEENAARRASFPSQAKMKHYQRKYKYGLSEDEVRALLASQDGACAICRRQLDVDAAEKNAKVSVDHHHASGVVRGILCQACNAGVGMFGDDPTTLLRAVAYLKHHDRTKGVA